MYVTWKGLVRHHITKIGMHEVEKDSRLTARTKRWKWLQMGEIKWQKIAENNVYKRRERRLKMKNTDTKEIILSRYRQQVVLIVTKRNRRI